jgi:hypothetical protein
MYVQALHAVKCQHQHLMHNLQLQLQVHCMHGVHAIVDAVPRPLEQYFVSCANSGRE